MHLKTKFAGLAAGLAAALLVAPGCKKSQPPEPPPPPAPAQAAPAPAPAPGAPAQAPVNPHDAEQADPHAAAMGLPPLDDAMRAVYAYPVTLPKAEAYCKAIKELRAAGEKDEQFMTRLRAPKPPGNEQAKLAKWLEDIPPLKALLDRNGLKGLDLVLMPQALMQGRMAYAQERQGSPVPPDRTNTSVVALHRADWNRMDVLVTDCMADLRVISGR